jgi:shikimate dehydrogenase
MRKFGLIGYPLSHSFSKKYFTEKFINENISDCSYENFPLTDISLLQKLVSGDKELYGLNVTIPYKSEVISQLRFVEKEAKEIGAVNVIKIKRSGTQTKLYGYNSDITGIADSLSPYFKGDVRNAIVLGTGGSSRAVCYVLKKSGLKITRVSRNRSYGIISYQDIIPELLRNTDLIVNTTPLGMFPDTDSKPDLNYDLLNKNHILFDLVYNPERTAFLKMGEEKGCIVIGGMKMLHSQAEKAWEIWNDPAL